MTTTTGTRRWPVHPPPAPGEALTSWRDRLARLYGAVPLDLLRDALGEGQALLDDPRAADLDFDQAWRGSGRPQDARPAGA